MGFQLRQRHSLQVFSLIELFDEAFGAFSYLRMLLTYRHSIIVAQAGGFVNANLRGLLSESCLIGTWDDAANRLNQNR